MFAAIQRHDWQRGGRRVCGRGLRGLLRGLHQHLQVSACWSAGTGGCSFLHRPLSLPQFACNFSAFVASFKISLKTRHAHAHTGTHAHTHARTHARLHTHANTHTYKYTHTHTHARTHARTHTRTRARKHTHTHTHTLRARAHTHTHTHTRTHTHSSLLNACSVLFDQFTLFVVVQKSVPLPPSHIIMSLQLQLHTLRCIHQDSHCSHSPL